MKQERYYLKARTRDQRHVAFYSDGTWREPSRMLRPVVFVTLEAAKKQAACQRRYQREVFYLDRLTGIRVERAYWS